MKHTSSIYIYSILLFLNIPASLFPTDMSLEQKISFLSQIDYSLKERLGQNIRDHILHTPNVVEAYVNNPYYVAKIGVIRALSYIPDPSFAPYLLAFLAENDKEIVLQTINAMGKTRISEYEQTLYAICDEHADEQAIVVSCLFALGEYSSDQTVEYIASHCIANDLTISTAVVLSLGKMGTPKATSKLILLFDKACAPGKKLIIEQIGSCRQSPAALRFLEQFLVDKENPYFVSALKAAGKIESLDHLPLMLECLSIKNTDIQQAAIYAISCLGQISSLKPLFDLIDNSNPLDESTQLAYGAIEKICALYTREEILESITRTDHPAVLIDQLGNLYDASSVPVLTELLYHEDPVNRIFAVHALGKIDNDTARENILKRLPEATALEYVYELELLKKWYTENKINYDDLKQSLGFTTSGIFKRILYAAAINNQHVENAIFDLLRNPNNPFTWVAVYAIEDWPSSPLLTRELLHLLKKGDLLERYYCARTLNKICESDKNLAAQLKLIVPHETNTRIKTLLQESPGD